MPTCLASRVLAACLIAAPLVAVAAGQTDHPFQARFTLVESLVFTGRPPCGATSQLVGSGQSAAFGSFTVASQDCINPLGSFDPNHPNSNTFAFASIGSGLVFTTGTGDRIFAVYSGNATPQGYGPLRLSGQFVVTGGTGAYFAATGGGVLFGSEDLSQVVTGQGEMTVLGLLRY